MRSIFLAILLVAGLAAPTAAAACVPLVICVTPSATSYGSGSCTDGYAVNYNSVWISGAVTGLVIVTASTSCFGRDGDTYSNAFAVRAIAYGGPLAGTEVTTGWYESSSCYMWVLAESPAVGEHSQFPACPASPPAVPQLLP